MTKKKIGKKPNKKATAASKNSLMRSMRELLYSAPSKTFNYKQISSALNVKGTSDRMLIVSILRQWAEDEIVDETSRGKYKVKEQKEVFVEGKIDITKRGAGYVVSDELDEDIFIPSKLTNCAFNGDIVKASYSTNNGKLEGRVVEVVTRYKTEFVGIVQKGGKNTFVVPDNFKIHVDFYIPRGKDLDAVDGDKVIVKMTDWDNPGQSPFGKITKVLGTPGEHNVEMTAILAEYGLPIDFPASVEDAAGQISIEISADEIKKRKDFRSITTFTIDPENAKDFDDALSFQKLKNGNVEVGIHIADVSHYVQPKTILDSEAFHRATSVYLVDRVVPMLPEVLSNGVCSLRPNEDKLCFSAVFELNENAEIKKQWFGRTVIHSDRRFTYEEAQTVIETGKGDFSEEILTLNHLAKLLREKRMAKGSIQFGSDEVRFILDEDGAPIGVYKKEIKDANLLIEDFMLLANKKVAQLIGDTPKGQAEKTFVYRVHDEPNPEKLHLLKQFAHRWGHKFSVGSSSEESANNLNKLLESVKNTPEEDVIKTMAIRSMAKATYTTDNVGHFGLGFSFYSHFTSPIRRYPDVMVHRLLAHYLDNGNSANKDSYEEKCLHSSFMEKKATEAERASIKYKQVEFMLDKIGNHFRGLISGITTWGIYVELDDTKVEGMISLKNIPGDQYYFDEKDYCIRGTRNKKEFTLGDTIAIEVIGADLVKKQLDFELVEE